MFYTLFCFFCFFFFFLFFHFYLFILFPPFSPPLLPLLPLFSFSSFQTSQQYQVDRFSKILPPQFLHESALLLSRQGRHRDVLHIYVDKLRDLRIAEAYCERIYHHAKVEQIRQKNDQNNNNCNNSNNNNNSNHNNHNNHKSKNNDFSGDFGVYLLLLEEMLSSIPSNKTVNTKTVNSKTVNETYNSPKSSPGKNNENESGHRNDFESNYFDFQDVMLLAERSHDRINVQSFLALIPKSTPMYLIEKYLRTVIEYGNHKKRNLMVSFLFSEYFFKFLLF